jgi:alkanesulfonate monooxygenase SsuD/methylene tetrahydromethanopterin reductase-like flavin-dependent oxidoreductase (luciferase family)
VTAKRRGVALTPMETRHDVIVRAAQLADELGYEAFAVPEGWGLDSTLLLAELALRTRRITLVSAILSVWGRTPATLAMTAATLYRLAQGRYVLGLGTSTRALVEGFHDVAFERPADKLREVTTKVRALLAGERAQLDNTAAARPLRLGLPPVLELPIWLAALGGRTSRVAAELGDGWIPVFLSPERLAGRVADLDRARRAAGRSEPLTVAAGPWTVADADPGAARGVVAASPGTCRPWATSTAAPWPTRDMAPPSRPSRPPTRGPGRRAGPSQPRPGSCWTSSPPTGRLPRSASSWSAGTARPTSPWSACRRACPGTSSKRPCAPPRLSRAHRPQGARPRLDGGRRIPVADA